jgi:hypothetical protein
LGGSGKVLIPIPVIVKRVAEVQGAVWKLVKCAQCGQEYAYLVELQATGVDHDVLILDVDGSGQRAQARAEESLSRMARNVVLPVPCPHCGAYQDDMVRLLKEEGTSNGPLIAGLIVGGLSLIPLAFEFRGNWMVTAAGVGVGLALIAYGDLAMSRYNPNAGDPEPRKARGRRHAVWGEKLVELLAALKTLDTGPDAVQPPTRDCAE